MIGFVFSRKVNTIFKTHDRVLFFNRNFIYILPEGYEIPSNIDYINKENSLYYTDDLSLFNILQKFEHIILSETMNLQWYLESEEYRHLKQINDGKIWYITHGIASMYNEELKDTYRKMGITTRENKHVNVLVLCNFIYKALIELCPNNKDQIIKINSLPQFFNNENIVKSVNRDDFKNTICIVGCILSDNEIDHIHLLVDTINNLYKDTNIVVKYKSKYSDVPTKYKSRRVVDLINKLKSKSENISVDFYSPIVKYAYSKKIIVIAGGTSYFEILQYNNNTFIYPLYNKYYTKIPLDFKKLLIPNDVSEFEKYLKLSDNEKYYDDEYMIEKKKVFKFQMGTNEIVIDTSKINDFFNSILTGN